MDHGWTDIFLAKSLESGFEHPWIWDLIYFPGFGIRLFSESGNIKSWRGDQILGLQEGPLGPSRPGRMFVPNLI